MNPTTRRTFLLLLCTLWLGPVQVVSAQAAPFRYELLSLLPDDFAVCIVMHDLRGHAERWQRSDWLKTFRKSPLGKTLLEAPEFQQIERWEKELKKHFDLDWSSLRDDIFGDTVLLSYSPGPENKPEEERGLFLIHTRNPARLKQFIDRLNQLQTTSGELKSLTTVQYKDKKYLRRAEGSKTQYYLLEGPLLAVSSREALIRTVLDKLDKKGQKPKSQPWAKRFQKAGAERSFVTMCVNPRTVVPEFLKNSKKTSGFPNYWQALEGIFVSVCVKDEAELRLSIQANADALPSWIRPAFTETMAPSTLWQCFPEPSIVTLASQTDFAALMDALQMLVPDKDRKNLVSQLEGTVGAVLGRDLLKEVLPNIGPDWGMCVLPAKNAEQLPQLLFAMAVKPGSKNPPIDRALYQSVQIFARFAIFDYNKKHTDEIRLQTVMQSKIEVSYLSNDKLFPPGLQPACALKEGFLIFASSPTAIEQFRLRKAKAHDHQGTPLFTLSTRELAKLVRQRQEPIINNLKQRQHMPEGDAVKNVSSVIALLDLFKHVTLSHHVETGQASWTLRLTPWLTK